MIDRTYRILTKRNNGVGKPEYRLRKFVHNSFRAMTLTIGVVPIFPGTLCLPIGLLIGGWTAQKPTHWIGPDIVRLILKLYNYTLMCVAHRDRGFISWVLGPPRFSRAYRPM